MKSIFSIRAFRISKGTFTGERPLFILFAGFGYQESSRSSRILRESYPDFGPTLAAEKRKARHHIVLSKKTVRRLQMDAGLQRLGCLGRTRSEGPHSLDEGVDLWIGPDGDAAPVLVRWKTPPDNDIPMPHELGELLDRRARVEEHEITVWLGVRKVQSRQFGDHPGPAR